MAQKLNCILLIDDDIPTNIINKMVIDEAECAEKVIVKTTARQALEYLRSKEDGVHPRPDLIFLDINMPGMDGWDFMEEYNALDDLQKGKIVIVMLTTSLNPDDAERARRIKSINDFRNKPLTKEMLMEILERYFPGRF